MEKKISIALATYNGAKYLRELLNSLAKQTYLPTELVISDDNSSDDTIEIIQHFAKTAPFKVHMIENSHQLGVIQNFATAFKGTSGDLIAYCDQDDIWAPDKLEKCVHYFDAASTKLVMHRSEVVDSNLQPLGFCVPDIHENEYGQTRFPSSPDMTQGLGHQMLFCGRMYREYAWIFQQGFPALKPYAENYDIQFRFLAGFNGDIQCLEETLVKFRRHPGATSDAGLMDWSTATTSGFLSKSPKIYYTESETLMAIARTFEHEVIQKMPAHHHNTLSKYIRFLKKKAARYYLRGAIYDKNPLWRRFGAYLTLIVKGAYATKRHYGFGHKGLIVDLFVSVFGLGGSQRIIALKQEKAH